MYNLVAASPVKMRRSFTRGLVSPRESMSERLYLDRSLMLALFSLYARPQPPSVGKVEDTSHVSRVGKMRNTIMLARTVIRRRAPKLVPLPPHRPPVIPSVSSPAPTLLPLRMGPASTFLEDCNLFGPLGGPFPSNDYPGQAHEYSVEDLLTSGYQVSKGELARTSLDTTVNIITTPAQTSTIPTVTCRQPQRGPARTPPSRSRNVGRPGPLFTTTSTPRPIVIPIVKLSIPPSFGQLRSRRQRINTPIIQGWSSTRSSSTWRY